MTPKVDRKPPRGLCSAARPYYPARLTLIRPVPGDGLGVIYARERFPDASRPLGVRDNVRDGSIRHFLVSRADGSSGGGGKVEEVAASVSRHPRRRIRTAVRGTVDVSRATVFASSVSRPQNRFVRYLLIVSRYFRLRNTMFVFSRPCTAERFARI